MGGFGHTNDSSDTTTEEVLEGIGFDLPKGEPAFLGSHGYRFKIVNICRRELPEQ